jgi:hypothetical protein
MMIFESQRCGEGSKFMACLFAGISKVFKEKPGGKAGLGSAKSEP